MNIIDTKCHGIVVTIDEYRDRCFIESDLKGFSENDYDGEYNIEEIRKNSQIYILQELIVSHAFAGVNIKSPAYLEGIESVIAQFRLVS